MIITWTLVALASLIIGGILSVVTKDTGCFVVAIVLSILIGFGHLIVIVG